MSIPFIQIDPTNPSRFVIDDRAKQYLTRLKGPVCPIIVCGPYRSGKSSLLNFLAQQNEHVVTPTAMGKPLFNVGGTVQACTKGIWIYSAPPAANGKTILFLDCEGLGSVGAHQTFDTQLFSLSVLLSSLFVLNTKDAITESSLEQLELVVEMTKRVRVDDERTESSLGDLSVHFPSFLWIIRDFALELSENGHPITARQYLEKALQPVPVSGNATARQRIEEKNRVRSTITQCFTHRDCITLVRPVTNEKDLQKLNELSSEKYRLEFKQQIEELKNMIYRTVTTKQLNGIEMNGSGFVALATAYVDAMNSGSIPSIRSAWSSAVELQGREAVDVAYARFVETVNKYQSELHNEQDLNGFFQSLEQSLISNLRADAIGDRQFINGLEQRLLQQMQPIKEKVILENQRIAEEHCRQILERLIRQDQVETWITANDKSLEQKLKKVDFILLAFYNEAKGPNDVRLRIGNEWKNSTLATIASDIDNKMRHAAQHIEHVNGQLQQANTDRDHSRQRLSELESRDEANQNRLHILSNEQKDLRQQLSDAQRKLHQAELDTQKQAAELHRVQLELQRVQASSDVVSRKRQSAQSDLARAQQQTADLETRLAASAQQMNDLIESKQHAVQEMTVELEATRKRALQEISALNVESHFEIERLKKENAALIEEMNAQSVRAAARPSHDGEHDMDDVHVEQYDDEEEPPVRQSLAPPPGRSAASSSSASSHRLPSLASNDSNEPGRRRQSSGLVSRPPTDPNKLTIQELKSWLTELEVNFPMASQPKQFYLDKIYETLPELEHDFPRTKTTSNKRQRK